MIRILPLIVILFLSACSGKDSSEFIKLTGRIENNKFTNNYLTVDAGDWTIRTDSLDKITFLELSKNAASIDFGAHEKSFFDKAGITSEEDHKRTLIKSFQSDPEYKIIYDKKIKIDGHEFLTLKVEYKTSQTIFYIGEMREYYLAVIFIEDNRWPVNDAEKLITGIKFN